MTMLLTGAGGFLGKRLAQSLLRQGVTHLRLHFRQAAPAAWIAELAAAHPAARIEAASANLLSPPAVESLVGGVTAIVHAAAGVRGAGPDMFLNTVVASRNLLDAALAAGVRRITLVSSFAVYRTDGLARGALLDERVPMESVGTGKGDYAYAKTRQEQLFRNYAGRHDFELVTLRPGVIYGPGGGAFSPRVGLAAMGLFASLGGPALLPLTYVENCADAVAHAALRAPADSVFNVVDDDLPTCSEYLKRYRREVRRLRVVRVPYWLFLLGSRWLEAYNRRSRGQLPAVLPPYTVRSMFRPLRYSNAALKQIGWRPRIATEEGLRTTFAAFRAALP